MKALARLITYRYLIVGVGLCVIGGCSINPAESFIFQADMPANFVVDGTAYYVPAPGETCRDPAGVERQGPGRVFFKSERPRSTKLVEFKVPLTDTEHGCSMVLDSLGLDIEGQWGQRELDMSKSFKGLSISDQTSMNVPLLRSSEPLIFETQCQWHFRTVGSKRFIRKILKCGALQTNSEVKKSLMEGGLPRDQLAGKTVKLVLAIAKEEEPYFGRTWLKTPEGWKPCMETEESFWCRSPPTFTTFKMPDGRDCTVYPNCTE